MRQLVQKFGVERVCLFGAVFLSTVTLLGTRADAQATASDPITCQTSEDTCTGTLSSLLAIGHGYTVAETDTTVLYRVKVGDSTNTGSAQPGSWSPGTAWGDGTNGFFYQAVVNGDTANPLVYVPFNGIAIDAAGDPALPPFDFIVPVDVTSTSPSPSITISACSTNYAATGSGDTCAKTYWTDTYESLPEPTVAEAPVAINLSTFSFSECLGQSCSVPNNGVYPFMLTLSVDASITGTDLEWVKDHLVFFDKDGNAFLNDINGQQLGVLTLEDAAYLDPATSEYFTKYGNGLGIKPASPANPNEVNLFFYTTAEATAQSLFVGAAVLHDRPDNCTGFIEPSFTTNKSCSLNSAPPPNISPQAELAPVDWTPDTSRTAPTQDAGISQIRTVKFAVEPTSTQAGSTCNAAVNPLAVSVTGAEPAYSPPNFVVGATGVANGLYYVVPSGFGTCDVANDAPFCTRSGTASSPYAAYTPHYLDADGSGGMLNGGSTTSRNVLEAKLADQYWLSGMSPSQGNALTWFDNCGYQHLYEETETDLAERKKLPTPPNNRPTLQYSLTNELDRALVFGKECCASWYQENTNINPPVMEPPVELSDGFGMTVPYTGDTRATRYGTLFTQETSVVYDATTGNKLFKIHLNSGSGGPQVYQCGANEGSLTTSGTAPAIKLSLGATGTGARTCSAIGACPFNMSAGTYEQYKTCSVAQTTIVLGLEDWVEENFAPNTKAQVMVLARGGHGKDGSHDDCSGGAGGLNGTARTTLAAEDLAVDGLYYYSGKSGGSSWEGGSGSILSTVPLSSITDPGTVTDPGSVGVLLIAGGGGAGGDGNESLSNCAGRVGGKGGTAISTNGVDASSAGASSTAAGGNSNKEGNGGSKSGSNTSSGKSGLGGWGGDGRNKWINGPLIPPQSWSAGNGGKGNYGGDGGGGFGGGGGAGSADVEAGGGGGSWATANLANPISLSTPSNNPSQLQFWYSYKTPYMPGSEGYCPYGTNKYVREGSTVSCIITESTKVNTRSWIQTAISDGLFDNDMPIRMTAWGGAGGNGASVTVSGSTKAGGPGGAGGTATRTMTMESLIQDFGTTNGITPIFMGRGGGSGQSNGYGAGGGSSTWAMIGPNPILYGPNQAPANTPLSLLAGGGGGGGSAVSSSGGQVGYSGGAGGVIQSAVGSAGHGNGSASCSGAPSGVSPASGGAQGTGGNGNVKGGDGVGGFGGGGSSGQTNWLGGSSNPWAASKYGNGAVPKHATGPGGGGGGGWGGGGAAASASSSSSHGSCGGGGGTSWAKKSTSSGSFPQLGSSPNGRNGAVEFYYELSN